VALVFAGIEESNSSSDSAGVGIESGLDSLAVSAEAVATGERGGVGGSAVAGEGKSLGRFEPLEIVISKRPKNIPVIRTIDTPITSW
jgi:hypothetical protein